MKGCITNTQMIYNHLINYSDKKYMEKTNMSCPKITIVCSLPDPASVNIANHILDLAEWEETELPSEEDMKKALDAFPLISPEERRTPGRENKNRSEDTKIIFSPPDETSFFKKIYLYGPFRLLFLDGRHIFQDRLDKRLEFLNLPASRIIFISKHSSQSEMKSLTVHSTGNPGDAVLGGFPNELAVCDPLLSGYILHEMNVKNEQYGLGFDVTMEVTHHGPTEIDVPSMFVEIGSTEKEWKNKLAGKIIAESVFSVMRLENLPESYASNTSDLSQNVLDISIAVGFGGGHYAQRQTKHLLEKKLYFGHVFPKYVIGCIDEPFILKAFEKSHAQVAYFDKKSISGPDRRRISEILEKNNIKIFTDADLKSPLK